jgi:GNAT superfamily N-acetyltransferase
MEQIQRLLTEQVEIGPQDCDSSEARACLNAYFSELARQFPNGFNPALSVSAEPEETRPPNGQFLLLRRGGHPLGCGAVKTLTAGVGEIKRMWIHPKLRGLGLGRRLLARLEDCSLGLGHHTVRLDTSEHLGAAITLYRSAGYTRIPAYNDNPYATHWFQKRLRRG